MGTDKFKYPPLAGTVRRTPRGERLRRMRSKPRRGKKEQTDGTDRPVSAAAPPRMRFSPGGPCTMGSEHFYPQEAPLRQVRVDGFWIDAAPVTNRDFARFVADTGHVTAAAIAPYPRDHPGMFPGMHRAG